MRSLVTTAILLSSIFVISANGQRNRPGNVQRKPVIFAVLHDGKTLEPIAFIENGKLVPALSETEESGSRTRFHKTYYRPGITYKLIFGGTSGGTTIVRSSDPKAECSGDMATVSVNSSRITLRGFVMGLATNTSVKTGVTSFRRLPTPDERAEIDRLAKDEFEKNNLNPKTLRYHNMTAIDVDHDGVPEFVGSYWVEIDKLTRGLLFLIAEKGEDGKYSLGYSEFRTVDQENTMSGDISDVDSGIYHELLLESLDVDGDGTGEIFTYTQSFEGAGFTAYKRNGDTWEKSFEVSNYHCGY